MQHRDILWQTSTHLAVSFCASCLFTTPPEGGEMDLHTHHHAVISASQQEYQLARLFIPPLKSSICAQEELCSS